MTRKNSQNSESCSENSDLVLYEAIDLASYYGHSLGILSKYAELH